METTSRSYEMRIDRKHSPICKETYDYYVRNTSIMLEFWTDLFGGYDPRFNPENDIVHTFEAKDKKNENGDITCSEQVRCFVSWFTPTNRPDKASVDAKDLRETFLYYWKNCLQQTEVIDAALEHLFNTLQEREKVVWVDRRQRFMEMGVQIDKTFFQLIPNFSTQEFRTMQTQMWPKRDQTNYGNLFEFYDWLSSYLESAVGKNWDEVRAVVADKETKAELNKNGRYPSWKVFIFGSKNGKNKPVTGKVEKTQVEEIVDLIGFNTKKNQNKSEFVKYPWMEESRVKFEQLFGEYEFDTWSQIIDLGVARYSSWRSNFIRQLVNRVYSFEEYYKVANEISSHTNKLQPELGWVTKLMTQCRERQPVAQRFITSRQVRGFSALMSEWNELENPTVENLLKAIDEVEKQKGKNNFGDRNLFETMARNAAGSDFSKVRKSIEAFLDCEDAQRRYETMLQPVLNWPDFNNPSHPWFGESKPEGKITLGAVPPQRPDGKPVKNFVYSGEVSLKTVKGIQKLHVVSKRFFTEVFVSEEGVELARNHPLLRCLHGVTDQSVKPLVKQKDVALQLFPRKNQWYFKATVKLETRPVLRFKELVANILEHKNKVDVLGIDVGLRNRIAFAHIRLNEGDLVLQHEGKTLSKKHFLKFNKVEWGNLEEHMLTQDGKVICRLGGGYRRPLTAKEMDSLKEARKELDKNGSNWIPLDQVQYNRAFSYVVLKIVRSYVTKSGYTKESKKVKSPEQLARAEMWLNRLLDTVLGNCKNAPAHAGGLSIERMEALRNVLSALNSVQSVYGDATTNWSQLIEKIRNRLNQVRREAIKVGVSLIIRKAIEVGARLVVMEDLSLTTNQVNSKRHNNKMSDFCCRKMLSELESQASLYGIRVKKVMPQGTSLSDFSTPENNISPKFSCKTVEQLKSAYFVETVRKQMKSNGGVRATLIRKFWEDVLGKDKFSRGDASRVQSIMIENAKKNGGTAMVPDFFGTHYSTAAFGWVDSDWSAAAMVAKSGVRDLLGWRYFNSLQNKALEYTSRKS